MLIEVEKDLLISALKSTNKQRGKLIDRLMNFLMERDEEIYKLKLKNDRLEGKEFFNVLG